MATCSRCGNVVEFRYVDGKFVPLHVHGSCTGSNSSKVNDYSGYNISHDSTCFCTTCPECGEKVFFVRYNGGSVWLDPPLGYPWYKHACFSDEISNLTPKLSLAASHNYLSSHNSEKQSKSNLIIGIVKSTYFDIDTDIIFETGNQEVKNIILKHNAGFLLGKVCIYDTNQDRIWPLEEPHHAFSIYKPIAPQNDSLIYRSDLISCPKCGVKLNPKNLSKHLKRQHGTS
ncbi:hypothetical protein [Methylomagnum sp.]